jgi:hypothetical protein
VRVHEQTLAAPVAQRSVNNLFVGLGVADLTDGGVAQGNFSVPQALLQDNRPGRMARACGRLAVRPRGAGRRSAGRAPAARG